ncbi:homeobox protein MSH-D-like [Zerene cesonia]|uniref:homeobox protein MSH-D-like n=1 Tax=Zerene cesonia TaxID=33412 RepID=UPI0018E510D2|nr:homeobox protein MSH-D-like [Zerene cesonia]
MNLSPAQSSSKCNSDFSIERILSDDSNSREVTEAPSWVCCTRYQPPRLPRTTTACRSRRSGRHARVPFTASQAAALEAAYTRSPYLAPPALRALAAALQLRDDRIKIWFQNRRARERREKSSNIQPPQSIALPSTHQRFSVPRGIWVTASSAKVEQDVISTGPVFQQRIVEPQIIDYVKNICAQADSGSDSNNSSHDALVDVEAID